MGPFKKVSDSGDDTNKETIKPRSFTVEEWATLDDLEVPLEPLKLVQEQMAGAV